MPQYAQTIDSASATDLLATAGYHPFRLCLLICPSDLQITLIQRISVLEQWRITGIEAVRKSAEKFEAPASGPVKYPNFSFS